MQKGEPKICTLSCVAPFVDGSQEKNLFIVGHVLLLPFGLDVLSQKDVLDQSI